MGVVKASHGQSRITGIKLNACIARGCELLLAVLLLFTTASAAVAADVYVDSSHSGPEEGTSDNPFISVQMALRDVSSGDTLYVKGPLEYPGTMKFSVPVTIRAWEGSPTIGVGLGVLLHRIRYRLAPGVWTVNLEFPEWDDADVSWPRQRDILVAPYWVPSPANVKYVFIFSAGQQFFRVPCVTTGQYDNWDDFPAEDRCVFRLLNEQSMAGKIIAQHGDCPYGPENGDYPWGPENTLLLLAFRGLDAKFADHAEQEKIVEGYRLWIDRKISSFENLELIYLCGASRGGALAVRLGHLIRELDSEPPGLVRPKILISCFDGVADEDQDVPGQDEGEMMTMEGEDGKIYNPEDTTGEMYGFYAKWFGEDGYFGGVLSESLKIYQIMGEGLPISLQHCFVSGPTQEQAGWPDHDWGFYKHTWVPYDHETICNAWHEDVADPQLEWFFDEAFPED